MAIVDIVGSVENVHLFGFPRDLNQETDKKDRIYHTVGVSGREIGYCLSPVHISVWDPHDRSYPQNQRYRMIAKVTDGVLEYILYTRHDDWLGRSRVRHPEMWAYRFSRFAFGYFESAGTQMTACRSTWLRGESQYREYQQGLRVHGDKIRAARETWSGNVLMGLGFRKIGDEDIKELDSFYRKNDRLEVMFYR